MPQQQCHNSKSVIFQEKSLKISKCYNFLWVQRRHSCSPAASFANCVMTLYLLKVNLQTFLSIPITQKCQIFSCDTLVANKRCNNYIKNFFYIVICSTFLKKEAVTGKFVHQNYTPISFFMTIFKEWSFFPY